jgi:hypothetical protein
VDLEPAGRNCVIGQPILRRPIYDDARVITLVPTHTDAREPITLLLVSHAGYVTNEAVPHSVAARAGAERESAVPLAEPDPAQT